MVFGLPAPHHKKKVINIFWEEEVTKRRREGVNEEEEYTNTVSFFRRVILLFVRRRSAMVRKGWTKVEDPYTVESSFRFNGPGGCGCHLPSTCSSDEECFLHGPFRNALKVAMEEASSSDPTR